ncbi:MAG TPA: hypothetical protein VF699_02230 [Caulobacteraceae bacterium]|jgi:uncharacterized membrane protein YtjA (UPF0391 family)
MLKWAGVFLILMIVAGILGFVLKVAGFIFQALFVVFLIGFVVTAAGRWLGRRTS